MEIVGPYDIQFQSPGFLQKKERENIEQKRLKLASDGKLSKYGKLRFHLSVLSLKIVCHISWSRD